MLLPPAVVPRDPARLAHPLAAVTGQGEHWTAFGADDGLQAAIGVEEPLTHRVGDYLGQPRTCGEIFVRHPDTSDYGGHWAARYRCIKPLGHVPWTDPHDGPRVEDSEPLITTQPIADLGLPAVVHATPMHLLLDPLYLANIAVLVSHDVQARVGGVTARSVPSGPDALRSAYGALLDACLDLRRVLKNRDGQ